MNKSVLGEWSEDLANIDKNLNPDLGEDFSIKKLTTDNNVLNWKDMLLTTDNTALYLGKIPKDRTEKRNSIYSKDAIKRLLEQLLPKVPDGNKLTIFDASDLSRSINQESQQDYLSHDQIVDLLEDIADDIMPHGADKVDVIRYSDKHPRLFHTLQEGGIDNFINIPVAPELSQDALSLELFTYLARLVQQPAGKELAQYAEGTLPKQLKQEAKENDTLDSYRLYALCEIACRIRDLMTGRSIQGGMERQAFYDRIIEYIVSKKFQAGSPMDTLQQYIVTSPHIPNFVGFYYNDDINLKNQEKKNKQKSTRSKIRNAGVIALFSLMSVLGYKGISTYTENAKLKTANEQLIKERTKGESVVEYLSPLDGGIHMEFYKDKLDGLIKDDIQTIKEYYTDRFGGWGDMTEAEFEGRVLDNLTIDQLKKIHHYTSERSKKLNEFIDQILIPQSQFSFIASQVPTTAYTRLSNREDDMINTLKTGIIGKTKSNPGYIGATSPDNDYLLYDGSRAYIPRSVEGNYFVARSTYDGSIDTNLTYKVIVDYFIQTRPGYRKVSEILETYMRHSRDYIYQYVEDTKREEVDKINFISNLIVNKINIPANDDVEVLRILKQIFMNNALGEGFSRHFARYNMFAGEFPTDTVTIENTRNHASMMYATHDHDPGEFKRIGQYPYIGYGSNNKLVFYEVIKAKVEGKRMYFARPVRTGDNHRDAYNPLMVYTFLTEELSEEDNK